MPTNPVVIPPKQEENDQQPVAGSAPAVNPNPRANENMHDIPDEDTSKRTEGVGTEITDGEDA